MKNLLAAVLPALAVFALGGCASTASVTSTEDDGVYYSSKDRTTAVASAPAAPNPPEDANPDYNGTTQDRSTRQSQGSGSNDYYDNSYTSTRAGTGSRSSVYYGPGLATYAPYSPYTTIVCSGFGPYGYGGFGYSPYAYGLGFADPFYSPFYSPFGYGYGSGMSIAFGFGRPYYGGFYGPYSGFGRPYAYGGFYDPYFYASPFYGGYYGRGGYYGSYYGGRRSYSNNGYYDNGNGNTRNRTSGHRTSRASDGRYVSGTSTPAGNTGGSIPTGGGRSRDLMAPSTGGQGTTTESLRDRRIGSDALTAAPTHEAYNQPRRLDVVDRAERQRGSDQSQNLFDNSQNGDRVVREDSRDRRRVAETTRENASSDVVSRPEELTRRRGDDSQGVPSQVYDNSAQPERQRSREWSRRGQEQPQRRYERPQQVAEQPQQTYERPQRVYEQPERRAEQPQQAYERPQRTYEQPERRAEQPQRVYEQPQRTYEQPQRVAEPQRSYSQPSYSAPSNGGGGRDGGSRGRSRD